MKLPTCIYEGMNLSGGGEVTHKYVSMARGLNRILKWALNACDIEGLHIVKPPKPIINHNESCY